MKNNENRAFLVEMGNRIRTRREELGLSQEQLAFAVGYKSRSSINKIELGKNDIPQSTIAKLASALSTTASYIMGAGEEQTPAADPAEDCPIVRIYNSLNESGQDEIVRYGNYLISQDKYKAAETVTPNVEYIRHYFTAAAAGYAAPIEGEHYEMVEKPADAPARADFCIDIAGDSMEPYIKDGDRVYVRRGADLQNLDVGIFFVDGDVYCKQYCVDYNGTLMLLSANEAREDANIYIQRDSGRHVTCFGRVLLPHRLPMPVYK